MMKKQGKIGKQAIFVTVLGALLLAWLPLQAGAANIKVGVIDCYSGPPAVYGNDALNGFKLAVDEINKTGVLGKQIEFTTRDTKFKVDIALNMAKELVMREEVDILVGTINSGAALAVSEAVAKTEKLPFIAWISKSERITGEKGHRYVFSTGENTAMAGKAGGVALSKKPYVKYWIAGDDYEYGHAIRDAAWRNLKKLKPEVELIGQSWWKPGEPRPDPLCHRHHGRQAGCRHLLHGRRQHDQRAEGHQGDRHVGEGAHLGAHGHRSRGAQAPWVRKRPWA